MIFVDTGALFAANIPRDPDHAAARAFLASNVERLVTTDYVVSELLTLLKARSERQRLKVVGKEILNDRVLPIEWVTESDVMRAWDVMCRFDDKAWSFTDCVSLVVMQRLGISKAFAFDGHFRQFGTITVVP